MSKAHDVVIDMLWIVGFSDREWTNKSFQIFALIVGLHGVKGTTWRFPKIGVPQIIQSSWMSILDHSIETTMVTLGNDLPLWKIWKSVGIIIPNIYI